MVGVSESIGILRPSSVGIFAQPPGSPLVAFNLSSASVPTPGRVRLDLAEAESFSRKWSVTRHPTEQAIAQNRIREPDALAITGMLSANPLLSPLASAGIVRLDKMELAKLRRLLDESLCTIVTPERTYANMACVSYSEHYDATVGDGVRLDLAFQEVVILIPGVPRSAFDSDAVDVGSPATTDIGAQAPASVVDPGGVG